MEYFVNIEMYDNFILGCVGSELSEILGCKELIEMFEKGTEKMTANYPLLVGIEVKESPLFPYRDQDGETIIGTILNREEGTISLIYRK